MRFVGPAVRYVVQAAKHDEFVLKTWWFPFVGSVPYLGYFDENDRNGYARELQDEGYEVYEGAVLAFSISNE